MKPFVKRNKTDARDAEAICEAMQRPGMRQLRAKPQRATPWIRGLLARRPVKVAVVAQAAKTARIAWAMLRSGEPYRAEGAAAEGA